MIWSSYSLFFLPMFLSCCVSEDNVTCIWKQTCILPCSFQGELKEASWSRKESTVPIIVKPPGQWYQHIDYRNIASMPEGGAALVISEVELKHQGLHRCSVTSSTGKVDQFIRLHVHAPVLDVSVRQEGPELICSSERIYPEPKVDWTPLSSDSYQTQTSVNATEDGLYTVNSSVRLPPNSAALSFTCNVSTAYSWRNATITPQDQDFTIRIVIYLILGVSFTDVLIACGLLIYSSVVVERKRQ